jgi:hypothetical protein
MYKLRDLRELYDVDFPEIEITERTKEIARESNIRGDARIAIGLFYTDKGYESHRKRVLRKPLP